MQYLTDIDVFEFVFKKMLQSNASTKRDGSTWAPLCKIFRQQNFGRLVLRAQETGYITERFPIGPNKQLKVVSKDREMSGVVWLQEWLRVIDDFKPCQCRCRARLWHAVRDEFIIGRAYLPVELKEHFKVVHNLIPHKRRRDEK